jgi:glyoxylase-like metal-dependent hydrolase (beta-lactamase superfamily II)
MRLLLKLIGLLVAAALVLAAAVLVWGHVQIRSADPLLPENEELLAADRAADLPMRLSFVDTASQRMPRATVLEPDLDPDPNAPYTMSHTSFVVEWQDGRIFLIDLGMDTAQAIAFGLPAETFFGASPIEPHVPTSARLGDNRDRVAGIGFTHMHTDHTGGLLGLCRDLGPLGPGREAIPVFQHHLQLAKVNHTTRPAKQQLEEAKCIVRRPLGTDGGLLPIPDFPGLFAIPAAGHTPGSTIYVVQLRTFPGASEGRYDDVETWVITGDVVNHHDGVQLDLPKPHLYSLLVVPEDDERLGRVRRFLRALSQEKGVKLLISHDLDQIAETSLPPY